MNILFWCQSEIVQLLSSNQVFTMFLFFQPVDCKLGSALCGSIAVEHPTYKRKKNVRDLVRETAIV